MPSIFELEHINLGSLLAAGMDPLGLQISALYERGSFTIVLESNQATLWHLQHAQELVRDNITRAWVSPYPRIAPHRKLRGDSLVYLELKDGTSCYVNNHYFHGKRKIPPCLRKEQVLADPFSGFTPFVDCLSVDFMTGDSITHKREGAPWGGAMHCRRVSYMRPDKSAVVLLQGDQGGLVQIFRASVRGNQTQIDLMHEGELGEPLSIHPMGISAAFWKDNLVQVVNTQTGRVLSRSTTDRFSWTRFGAPLYSPSSYWLFEDSWGRRWSIGDNEWAVCLDSTVPLRVLDASKENT